MKTNKIADSDLNHFVIVVCGMCDKGFCQDSDYPNDFCPRCGKCLHCGK